MKHRFKAFLFLLYFAQGIYGPYLVVFFSQKGFSGAQIGLMLGAMPISSILFQPLWGYLSDILHQRRILVLIGSLGVAAASLGLFYVQSFLGALLFLILFSVMLAPIVPINTAMVMDYLEETGEPETFSLFRLWGSLGFGVSSILIAGLFLDKIHVYFGWFMVVNFLLLGGLNLTLPEGGQSFSSLGGKGLGEILKNSEFMIFMAGSVMIGATLGINLNYHALHLQLLDVTPWLIGAIVSIQALVEIPFMLMVPSLMRRFSLPLLILAGALALPVRWLLYIVLTEPVWIMLAQIINGISTLSFFVVALSYVDQLVSPQWRATGQSVYSVMLWGFGSGLGAFIGGNFLDWFGVESVWYLSLVLGLIGLGLYLVGFGIRKRAEPENTSKT